MAGKGLNPLWGREIETKGKSLQKSKENMGDTRGRLEMVKGDV